MATVRARTPSHLWGHVKKSNVQRHSKFDLGVRDNFQRRKGIAIITFETVIPPALASYLKIDPGSYFGYHVQHTLDGTVQDTKYTPRLFKSAETRTEAIEKEKLSRVRNATS